MFFDLTLCSLNIRVLKLIIFSWDRIGPPGQRGLYDPSLDEISVGPQGPQGDIGELGDRGNVFNDFDFLKRIFLFINNIFFCTRCSRCPWIFRKARTNGISRSSRRSRSRWFTGS